MSGACSSASTVISDRYIPSGLVMKRFDGIDPAFLWQLNAEADRPRPPDQGAALIRDRLMTFFASSKE